MDRGPTSRVTSDIEPLLTIVYHCRETPNQRTFSQKDLKKKWRRHFASRHQVFKQACIESRYYSLPTSPPQPDLAGEFACDIFGREKGQGQAQWRGDNALPSDLS